MLLVALVALGLASVLCFPQRLHPPLPASALLGLNAKDASTRKRLTPTAKQRPGTLLQGVGVGAWLTTRQLHLNREGQITERFTRAVDQLGSKQREVRRARGT